MGFLRRHPGHASALCLLLAGGVAEGKLLSEDHTKADDAADDEDENRHDERELDSCGSAFGASASNRSPWCHHSVSPCLVTRTNRVSPPKS